MIDKKLNDIKDRLLSELLFFNGNGAVIIKGEEPSLKGLDDSLPFFFYLAFDGEREIDFERDSDLAIKGSYRITANIKLVARFSGVEICSAMEVLFAALSSDPCVEITAASYDFEDIVLDESGEELKKCDFQVVRFNFTINDVAIPTNCPDLICKELC